VLPLLIASFAAYAFTFLEFKGREIYFASIVALMVIPLQAALVPVVRGLRFIKETTGLSLMGNFAGAWLVHSAFALPLAIYILRNYMMTLPVALIEAARIDGASKLDVFRFIQLPKMRGVLIIAVLLRFMDSFMIYTEPFVLTGGGPGNATTFLSQYLTQKAVGQFDLGPAAAFSLIYFLIILLLCFILYNWMQQVGTQAKEQTYG
jgi:glycerol transport system permease protein